MAATRHSTVKGTYNLTQIARFEVQYIKTSVGRPVLKIYKRETHKGTQSLTFH